MTISPSRKTTFASRLQAAKLRFKRITRELIDAEYAVKRCREQHKAALADWLELEGQLDSAAALRAAICKPESAV